MKKFMLSMDVLRIYFKEFRVNAFILICYLITIYLKKSIQYNMRYITGGAEGKKYNITKNNLLFLHTDFYLP